MKPIHKTLTLLCQSIESPFLGQFYHCVICVVEFRCSYNHPNWGDSTVWTPKFLKWVLCHQKHFHRIALFGAIAVRNDFWIFFVPKLTGFKNKHRIALFGAILWSPKLWEVIESLHLGRSRHIRVKTPKHCKKKSTSLGMILGSHVKIALEALRSGPNLRHDCQNDADRNQIVKENEANLPYTVLASSQAWREWWDGFQSSMVSQSCQSWRQNMQRDQLTKSIRHD
jgi:hypothetical protein